MAEHKHKRGDRVIISHNLEITDERHTVTPEMKDMIGKVYKISEISGERAFVNEFMFYTGDLMPLKKPKPIEPPVTFDPEQLTLV